MQQFRPTRFEILPTIIKNLLIINGLVFMAQNVFGAETENKINDLFALHSIQSSLFKPWQFITHLFLHGDFSHILSNMLALWMFGSMLENVWGPKRFLIFYFACGLGAAFFHMVVLYFENESMIRDFNVFAVTPSGIEGFIAKHGSRIVGEIPNNIYGANAVLQLNLNEATLGASGAVFGCLAAFGYLFPNTYIYVYFLLPIKAKWFVLLYAGFEFFSAIKNSAGDNVAHIAHLGGALVGIILVYFWNKTNRRTFY